MVDCMKSNEGDYQGAQRAVWRKRGVVVVVMMFAVAVWLSIR